MLLISHRGNVSGPTKFENHPTYIDESLKYVPLCEIDLWVINQTPYLGHDYPQYKIDWEWLNKRVDKILVHAKNIAAIITNYHVFYHDKDHYVFSSRGILISYPGMSSPPSSLLMKAENWAPQDIKQAWGICSDYILEWKSESS